MVWPCISDITVRRFGSLICEMGTIMVPLMAVVRMKHNINVLSLEAKTTHLLLGSRSHPILSHLEGIHPRTLPRGSPLSRLTQALLQPQTASNGELSPFSWLLLLSFSFFMSGLSQISPSSHLAPQLHFLKSTSLLHPQAHHRWLLIF